MSRFGVLFILIILAQVSCSKQDHPDTRIKKESTVDNRVFWLSFSAVQPQNFLKTALVMDVYAMRQDGKVKNNITDTESLEMTNLHETEGFPQKLFFKGRRNGNEFSMSITKTCKDRNKIVIPLEKSLVYFYFVCSLEKPDELKFLIHTLPMNKPDGAEVFSGGNFHFLTLLKKGPEFQFKTLASSNQTELSSKEELSIETKILSLEKMPQLEAK